MKVDTTLKERLETLKRMTFFLAAKSDDLALFVQHLDTFGANITDVDHNQNTLLHIVAESGKLNFLNELLKRNITLNRQNSHGDTALHIAARLNNKDISQALLKAGADSIIENYQDKLPLELTDDHSLKDLFRALLSRIFLYSIKENKHFFVYYCLMKGVSVNIYDRDHNNALHYTIINNATDLAKTLIERGINVNQYNLNRTTPLHIAAKYHNLDIIKLLLSVKNINLDAQDKNNNTALHYAIDKKSSIAQEIALLLIKAGANPFIIDAQDKNNNTALHYAIDKKSSIAQEIALLLIKAGANPFITRIDDFSLICKTSFQGSIPLLKEILKQDNHFYINQQNHPHNFSALHTAAAGNQKESMYELIHAGIDITLKADDGNTAYTLAKYNKFEEISSYLKNGAIALISASANGNLALVKKLLPKTKINISEKYGLRAIDLAAKFGHYNVAEYLLSKQASIKADKYGNTALHLAAENKHCNVLELLASKGGNLHQANLMGDTPYELAQECFD